MSGWMDPGQINDLSGLTPPIQTKLDRWRKKVLQLDKEHSKHFKKMRAVLKKSNEVVGMLRKKVKKRAKDPDLVKQLERSERDLMAATKMNPPPMENPLRSV